MTKTFDFSRRLTYHLLLDPQAKTDDPNGAFITCEYQGIARFDRIAYTSWPEIVECALKLTDEVTQIHEGNPPTPTLKDTDIAEATEARENFKKAIPDKNFEDYFRFTVALDPELSGTGDNKGAIIIISHKSKNRMDLQAYTDWEDLVGYLQSTANEVLELVQQKSELPPAPAFKPAAKPAAKPIAAPTPKAPAFKGPFTLEQNDKQRKLDMFDPFELTVKYMKNKNLIFEKLDEAIDVAKALAAKDETTTLVKDKTKKTAFDSSKPEGEIQATTQNPSEISNDDPNDDPDGDGFDDPDTDTDLDESSEEEEDHEIYEGEEPDEDLPEGETEESAESNALAPFTLWSQGNRLTMSIDHPLEFMGKAPNKEYLFESLDDATKFGQELGNALGITITLRDSNNDEFYNTYLQAS